jgi:hypothetical protein
VNSVNIKNAAPLTTAITIMIWVGEKAIFAFCALVASNE